MRASRFWLAACLHAGEGDHHVQRVVERLWPLLQLRLVERHGCRLRGNLGPK